MEMKFRWKTILAIVAMVLMANFILVETSAWARAGGGRSSGSRGSRSYSAPAGPSSPSPSSRPSPGVQPGISPTPSGGFMRSPFAQGLAGGLVGGMIGNMLFGSRGYGATGPGFGGSSIGLMDLILIGLGIYLIFRFLRRRRERVAYESSGSMDYQQPSSYGGTFIQQPVESFDQLEMSPEARNLQNGLEQIHRFDPVFNEVRFTETAQDLFFRIQAAWMNRSVEGAENILTDEMTATLLIQFAEMKQKGQINRLENIAIRKVEITEAWQESGNDFITVLFTANLLDYTVDDKNGQVVAGDQRNPIKFEEFWTFSRPSGHPQWALTAINQR